MRKYLPALLVLLVTVATSGDRYHQSARLLRNPDTLNPAESSPDYWYNEAKAGIEQRLLQLQNKNKARNVIMFLGDGMSIPTLAAARTLYGQRNNRTGEETKLYFETFPTVGLSKVHLEFSIIIFSF